MSNTVLLQEMTRADVEEYLEKESNPVILIAVGSFEQHGPHMPLGRDCYSAIDISCRVAEKTNSLVVQPTWIGYSPHHIEFKGTITFKAETLLNILVETCTCLAKHGFLKIMFINSHGGNSEIIQYAAMIARRDCEAVVVPEPPYSVEKKLKKERIRMLDFHSGKGETGRMMAIHPELVKLENLEEWEKTTHLPKELLDLLSADDEDWDSAIRILKSHLPDTHQFTASGIYGFEDPKEYSLEVAKEELQNRIDLIIQYIKIWKTIPLRPFIQNEMQ